MLDGVDHAFADRDAHLKSADFFDVEKFPEITFRGKWIQERGERRLTLVGDLTLRGVTREVVLDVESAGQAKDPWGNLRAAYSGRVSIDRKEFGLTWNQALEAGGVMVGDRVDIEIEVEAVKQVETKVA